MKNLKHIFIFVLFSFQANLFSQFGGTCSPKLIKERFLKSTVLIISTGFDEMDERLKLGFEKYWEHTDYKFVARDYKYSTSDKSISYLVPVTMTVEDNLSSQQYNRYALIMGGDEDIFKRTVADVVLDNFSHEKYVVDATYRATGIVKMMHDFIEMKIDGAKVNGQTITKVRYNSGFVYNKKSSKIKGKTLLISKSSMTYGKYYPFDTKGRPVFDKEKFKELYKHKVKFVSDEELQEHIDNGTEDYCYLLPVFARKKYIFVIDCETESVLYNGYSPSGLSIKSADIKKLNKAVSN
ncbi:MAG: hypothetical protein AB8B74_13275 [Crocinitomicaceae bacterium]